MNEEHKTTVGGYRMVHGELVVDDPESPGPGWSMCGSAVSGEIIFWFWERIQFTVETETAK